MVTDAGCLAKFRQASPAARTCSNEAASAVISGENYSCTITAACERDFVVVGLPQFYRRTSITVRWFELDKTNNCDGVLTPVRCANMMAAAHGLSLSVADARARERPGASLSFVVTLGGPASEATTVDYATSDGTASAGRDYRATRGTLTFAAGETAKTVAVPVLDDGHDEGAETLTLTNPHGARIADAAATGTIVNSDPVPKARLTGFGRALASGVVNRLGEHLTTGIPDSHVTLGGRRIGPAPDLEDGFPGGNADIGDMHWPTGPTRATPTAWGTTATPGTALRG